ncbi:hypothetical protein SDC9_184255 [bioreactor metagenome]|uniref:Uncharacterized protein n=1 Tax=bioreactor metagenome TaxID=1076179 RepID=A0A645HKT6_9ZZZZ
MNFLPPQPIDGRIIRGGYGGLSGGFISFQNARSGEGLGRLGGEKPITRKRSLVQIDRIPQRQRSYAASVLHRTGNAVQNHPGTHEATGCIMDGNHIPFGLNKGTIHRISPVVAAFHQTDMHAIHGI